MRRAVLLLPLLVLAAFMLPLRHGFTDDGFIHLQYAKHLIGDGEMAFNRGEPSFGTTSPLWVTALAAIGARLSDVTQLVDVSRLLSWLCALATLLVFYRLARAAGASIMVAMCATTALAADAWLARWSALGMETASATLAAAAVALTSLHAHRSTIAAARFGAMVAIAALLRPEMYLAVPVYLLVALTLRPRPSARVLLIAAAVAGAMILPWLIYAKLELGSFLPNTAGAKGGAVITSPLVFLAKFVPIGKIVLSTQAVAVTGLVADAVISRRRAVLLDPALRFCAAWIIALPLAYVLFDIQVLSRYLLLITPALCVLGWRSLENVAGRHARSLTLAGMVVAVTANAIFYTRVVLPPSRAFSTDLTTSMTSLARFLHDNSPPESV